MAETGHRRRSARTPGPGRRSWREVVIAALSIADDPSDDDDRRVRKRAGVVAGYLTIVAPLTLPSQVDDWRLGLALALSLSAFSVVNLVVLERTRRFQRYVVALLTAGVLFVPAANVLGGGVTSASSGLVWAFLVPGYAILALGPSQATRWFGVFVGMFTFMLLVDPLAHGATPPQPYELRLASVVIGVGVPLTITFLLLRYTDERRLEAEARSEELLANAIPRPIAARLRAGEHPIAEAYAETTVLFIDIVGFTPWAQRTDPNRVVTLLDRLFTEFDDLAAARGVEKIKTIGDAYMAVAGAPDPVADHAEVALDLGRAMLDAVTEWRSRHGVDLDARVGLASGPVVAGVIGRQRFLFDLWGDTVNVAARMESSGIPGRVQLAESTWRLVRDRHAFEVREVDVKGLGRLTTYLLASASVDGSRGSDR